MKNEIEEAFQKARQKIKELFPQFSILAEQPTLIFIETKDGSDITRSINDHAIVVNLYRVKWHLEREKQIPNCPKYDFETALFHDLFEYCYLAYHGYADDNPAINVIIHHRARVLENVLRAEKGLSPWI